MKNYKDYFKDKKVTMLGLGLLGRGLNDAKFLAECGADLTITDLKTAEQLKPTLDKLKKYKNIKYVLGKHQLEDFRDCDFVLKSAGVPLDSIYIEEAKKNNIPIEMDESLFTKIVSEQFCPELSRGTESISDCHCEQSVAIHPLCHSQMQVPISMGINSGRNPGKSEMDPRLLSTKLEINHGNDRKGVFVVGVTGTRGKTTTTYLIYEILKEALRLRSGHLKTQVFLGGNIKGLATLPLLKKVKAGDIVVMELSSWQLQGFGSAMISPQISVFTNLMNDHLNYYKGSMERYFDDKKYIYKNQKPEDFLITGESMDKKVGKVKSQKFVAKKDIVPIDWNLKIKGEHNLENIACAISVARIFGIEEKIIKKVVCNFAGVEGRQQFLRNYKGIKIYNDTTATTPDATIVALKSLGNKTDKNIILIMGGADKTLDMSELVCEIPKYCKKVILLAGTGTDKLGILNNEYGMWNKTNIQKILVSNLKEAVKHALDQAKRGDTVLFSPAFASFGMFKNEFDRGEQFTKIIKKLK
jgi:UDP-N-acetylmuramoylalanine--D-glutamate ligase